MLALMKFLDVSNLLKILAAIAERLMAHSDAHLTLASSKEDAIAKLEDEIVSHHVEARKVAGVANALKNLVGA